MKKMMSLALTGMLFAASANAASLSCWNSHSKDKNPYLTATISGQNSLSNIRIVDLSDETADQPQTVTIPGPIAGELIDSNHSPYKGYVQYLFKSGSADALIAPEDLRADSLAAIGQGEFSKFDSKGDGVNAVIIGAAGDADGAGNHYSIRLRCRSNF